tara:strand:+ start:148 stop:768 length:621 start_codon:yes stop_codon:yes gene_type:complete
MATKAKSNSIITARMTDESGNPADGPHAACIMFTVLGVGDICLTFSKLSAQTQRRAMVHGLTQRISDAAAIPFNKEENRYATAQEKFEAMQALVEHYHTGTEEWSRTRTAGGSRADGETTLILRAVAEHQGVTVDDMRERVKAIATKRETTPKAYLASVLATAQGAKGQGALAPVAAIYARLKAEQPKVEVKLDADELLDELGGVA